MKFTNCKKLFFIFLTVFLFSSNAFCDNTESDGQSQTEQTENPKTIPEYTQKDFRHVMISLTETFGSNLLLNQIDKIILKAPYADISTDTIWYNISHPWVWDQDTFVMNQLGHPYQGSVYFASARANGMNFYEGLAIAAFGSFTWEELMEDTRPSINDFITTPVVGSIFGEILHRLYCEAFTKSKVAAFFISPQDGFNYFITGQKALPPEQHITSLDLFLSAGISNDSVFSGGKSVLSDFKIPAIGGGVKIVYGKPYGLSSKTPFEQFNLNLFAAGAPFAYDIEVFSDGMLLSSQAFPQNGNLTTIGMNLIYNLLWTQDLNYSKTALGFAARQEVPVGQDSVFTWETNVNGTFLGGTDNYHLNSIKKAESDAGIRQRLYNLGIGGGAYSVVTFENQRAGKFSLKANADFLWYLPPALQDEGSKGCALIFLCQADYEHKIWENYSIGASVLYYHKNDFYAALDNIRQDYLKAGIYAVMKFGGR